MLHILSGVLPKTPYCVIRQKDKTLRIASFNLRLKMIREKQIFPN